jgi:pyruvate formate-lyase activating enzyme-like uncharacterized protein
LSPSEVKNHLLNLLSGKPIIIDQNNFQVFQEVFDQLGNKDFNLFFSEKYPQYQQNSISQYTP